MIVQQWQGFQGGNWQQEIKVRDFIQANLLPYEGDGAFLVGPTERTAALWNRCTALLAEERRNKGVLAVDNTKVSTITSHAPGYIDRPLEIIVGLQTDAPLKRGVVVQGGIRMAEQACAAYGEPLNPEISRVYQTEKITHNTAVFQAYTEEMKRARKAGIITGLPDAYGRGRIIGDYRRVALYGTARLAVEKQRELAVLQGGTEEENARLRQELEQQIIALEEMAVMAEQYGLDIRRPAANGREAVQWVYFAYLAGIKEQNGAAMSLGRVATFLDIYLERDIAQGLLDEVAAQELIDQLVIKLRLARQLRTPDYNELFAGDPLWITEVIGGMGLDGRTLVSKTSFRMLQTLYNLGPAPEPNLTVLWSEQLPLGFKNFVARVSVDTSAVQYENDDLMRPEYGDDYGIACCVSAMRLGEQMQFFGARANLVKALLLAINGGRDERDGELLVPGIDELPAGPLEYTAVRERYTKVLRWLANLYVETMNVIHRSHDAHAYEAAQMALHDAVVGRLMAFGVAGLSVAADSLSAIRFGNVQAERDERGISRAFTTAGDFPCFGNDDDRVDSLASEVVEEFVTYLRQTPTYRGAKHTLSVLTITSNVMYGKMTGASPDGRKNGAPFAPGANPMHGRERKGALAAMRSVTKLSYDVCQDGISYTFSVLPTVLGATPALREQHLRLLLDSYMAMGGHHINVNVLDPEVLRDAMEHPERHPHLTIRVSGYAVHFIKLNREQQEEVLVRTYYDQVGA